MDIPDVLTVGRTAHAGGDWQAAYDALSVPDALGASDLMLLGGAAWWLGRAQESLELTERAFAILEQDGDAAGAATGALDLALLWFTRGDLVVTSGWLHRARRLLAGLRLRPGRRPLT